MHLLQGTCIYIAALGILLPQLGTHEDELAVLPVLRPHDIRANHRSAIHFRSQKENQLPVLGHIACSQHQTGEG